MRVAFFGTPPPAVPYLRALAASEHSIVAVISQPDRPAGRGRSLRPSPVRAAADELALPVMTPEAASDQDFLDALAELKPQLGVVVAYGQILRRKLLDLPERGLINVHYSLLPQLRGAAPVYGALRQGLDVTGVTIQRMSRKLDAGDIILRREVPIEPDDNRGTLTERLTEAGVPLLLEAMALIERGEAPRTPQDDEQATYVGLVQTDDCRIDWSLPSEQVRNLVRACTPWPGAWCLLDGNRVKVQDVSLVQNVLRQEGSPGQIVEMPRARGPIVITGTGVVEITRLQPPGKRSMSGEEFLRGARLQVGDRFD
ncbi:MAG: methionyl-tRNA formyltransferase [candidate division WS1 bacterium]|jgi:methionyl-tRNA formyltransferase|nr:methionyl-tRNA formyltransferase [candidate division WS1 bacterium]